MSDRSHSFLDNLVRALERVTNAIERFTADLLEKLLRLLKDVTAWIDQVVRRIIEYGKLLLPALGHLGIALAKLAAFYFIGILLIIVGVHLQSLAWIIVGLVYIAGVTMIALFYRVRE